MGASAAASNVILGEAFPAGAERPGRRRGPGFCILFAAFAAAAGAALGLVASPSPGRDQGAANLAWTAAAAVQVAQRSEQRAKAAESALLEARSRLEQLNAVGAVQELHDWQEAEKLGLERAMEDRDALHGEKRRVMAAIVRESRRHGLDPLMVAAVIRVESRFDPFAVSPVGARGLMQLMPPTAQELFPGKDSELKARHLFNPVLNIELGTAYMGQLLRRFGGDVHRALIAYNAGPSVARSLVRGSRAHRRLSAYPRAVLAAYRNLLLAQQEGATRLAQR